MQAKILSHRQIIRVIVAIGIILSLICTYLLIRNSDIFISAQSGQSAGFKVFVTIEGRNTGRFRSGTGDKQNKDRIEINSFQMASSSVVENKPTSATPGKRSYSPITFSKNMDLTTPQIYNAIAKGELLTNVLFEFSSTDSKGVALIYQTVRLKNSFFESISNSGATGSRASETVSIVYQQIEMINNEGKTIFSDDLSK
jgi:type VI secretion system secreted protein Hcp